jgi:hypothetical protein
MNLPAERAGKSTGDLSPFGPAGGTFAARQAVTAAISRRTDGSACRGPRERPGSPGSGSKRTVIWGIPVKDNVAPSGSPASIAAVPSPSPAPTATSPITFYWISGGGKHLYAVVTYPNVIGQLPADVYYTVSTPAPTVTASPLFPVQLSTSYPSVSSNGVPNCSDQTEVAIALGNPCFTAATKKVPAQTRSGITWNYSANAPTYGAGQIAMVQIVNNLGPTANGTPSPNPNTANSSGVDGTFPYLAAVATGSMWQGDDSPANVLSTPPPCLSVTYAGSFTDYFMYQPGVTKARSGSRLWVTLGVMNWMFSGTAGDSNGAWTLTSHTDPTPKYQDSMTLPLWNQIRTPAGINC